MTIYVQKRPRVDVIQFNGSNGQDVVDFLGVGYINDEGTLIVVSPIDGEYAAETGMYFGRETSPGSGPSMWPEQNFLDNWEPV